jgi:capsular exopolysaccharide synthesis family protein
MTSPDQEQARRARGGGYEYAGAPPKNRQIEGVLDMLFRRRWIIAAVFVLATAAAVVYSFTQVPRYEANALVMVELNRMPSGEAVSAEGNTPFVRSDRSIATELFILQNSHAIHTRVHERLRELSAEDPSVSYPPKGGVQFQPASRSLNNALRVTAVSTDPQEAALLSNVYAEEYVRQTRDASRTYLVQANDFLEEQAASHRDKLRAAEDRVEEYMLQTGAVGLNQSGAAVVSRMANLEAQRDEARINMQMGQTQLAAIERQLEDINPQLARRVSSNVDRQLAALQAELARLEDEKRVILAAPNPDRQRLQEINQRVPELQREMDELSSEFVEEVMAAGGIEAGTSAIGYATELSRNAVAQRIELEGLQSRISTMNQRLGEYQQELNSIPGQSTELARLERTRQSAEQMYQYVVGRLQETQIALESEPGYARILRKASVPGVPSGANPWKNIALGLLLGLGAGIGLAFLRDKLDNRIYKPDQLRERDLDVLGVIPNMKPQIKKAYQGKAFVEHRGRRVATSLPTLLDPLSSASEAYRHLRTTVQFSRPGVVVQTVLVTSAAPSEGKSTTAANLALTMAQAKRRTLLVDADIRRPKQHQILDRPLEPGLVQVLSHGEVSPEVFQTSLDENLYVMSAGGLHSPQEQGDGATLVEEPSEMLGSKRMRDVLEMLRGQFDMIVIDSPPVLAATDAVLLSTQADATILVASAGTTKEGDLDHSLERLDDVGAHVIGVLLNQFDISMAYGYKYSYGQYGPYSKYSYGRDPEPAQPWWKRVGKSRETA